MKLVSFLVILIISALLMFFAVSNGFGVTEITEQKPQVLAATTTNSNQTLSGDDFVDAINRLRVGSGAQVVEVDEELDKIASIRLQDMVNRGYYAHQNPDGFTYDAYFESLPSYSCENLNLSSQTSYQSTIKDWFDSPEHKKCMLNTRVTKIGYAKSLMPELDSSIYVLILASE